jgi:uroporphyrinogen decarboxylase
VQLFDSWVGVLSPEDYRRHVLPHSKRILASLPVPSIHFGTRTWDLLELMREAGGDAVGVDWRRPIDEAWARLGEGVAVQGNLDPQALLGPRDELLRRTDDVLRRAAGRPGHIFNLGHGILPETPEESVAAVIERVHERTRR